MIPLLLLQMLSHQSLVLKLSLPQSRTRATLSLRLPGDRVRLQLGEEIPQSMVHLLRSLSLKLHILKHLFLLLPQQRRRLLPLL